MLLENIKRFTWYNEPQNFRFIENGLQIETAPNTDFWQNTDNGFSKDDGHIFASSSSSNFTLSAKWQFSKIQDSAQCGIIARADSQNWIKIGLLSPNIYNPRLGVVVANNGSSDWSIFPLPANVGAIWFQIKRRGRDFIACYSLDGITFEQIRMSHITKANGEIQAGAYACSPKNESFCCVLEDISLSVL